MTKEQIQEELQQMDSYIPISKIEESLGMPPTTLQKVLKGKRELPKKWAKILDAYFVKKVDVKPDNIANKSPKMEADKTGSPVPPMPIKESGENPIDFAARKNEWKLKYGQ